MRYSRSSLLSIAVTVGVSAVALTASVEAQNSTANYPWRAKAKTQVKTQIKTQVKTQVSSMAKAAVQKTDAVVTEVGTSFSKPTRDLRTVETIVTPTPSYESMPEVIYDEGKKYIRQGETYIESTDLADFANAGRATAGRLKQQLPSVSKKTSLFQKTRGLASRLNPFSTNGQPAAYTAKDWNIPSYSKTLPSFARRDNDPITFAAATPLPAKATTPSSIDGSQPLFATKTVAPQVAKATPTLSLPARNSQFRSALPTETKLTSALGNFETKAPVSNGFQSRNFYPVRSATEKIVAIESKAEANLTARAEHFATDVKSSLHTTGNIISHHGPQISIFENKVSNGHAPAGQRTASLAADDQFWTPRR